MQKCYIEICAKTGEFMNLKQIEAFSAVMTAGSVTNAANFLNVSQPAVSRLISDLERNTGLHLFERRGRRLYSTPEAHIFFEEVKKIFSGIKELKSIAQNIASFSTGHINIAALPALGHDFIPRVIKKFRSIYPDVTISLMINDSLTINSLVQRQHLDIGMIGILGENIEKDTSIFAQSDCVCVLPNGHRLSEVTSVTPRDLEGESFISFSQFTQVRNNIDMVFKNADVQRETLIDTQFATTICNFIGHGLGVSILSPLSLFEPNSLELVVKKFTPSIPIKYGMVLPLDRPQSQIAGKFIEVLNQYRDEELIRIDKMLG